MRTTTLLYSLFFLGLGLLGCKKDDENSYRCLTGTVVSRGPCDGTVIKLTNPDPTLLAKIPYRESIPASQVGLVSTYESFADTAKVGRSIFFDLRIPTKEESKTRICLAIYPSSGLPEVILQAPSCSR